MPIATEAAGKKPELLAPAGSLAMLDTAFAFGADAVYAGQPRYSLRVRNNDFGDIEVLAEGMRRARALGKAFYLVANICPHGAKLKTFVDDLAPAIALAPDALIVSDPGLLMLVRETWPELVLHLSVQANTVNAASVRFWAQNGVCRVILSRELSLEEIAEIRAACPDTELEVFVHGALCIAHSGRCLLSGYLSRRDANQGACTNSCRWEYKLQAHKPGRGEAPAAPPLTHGDDVDADNDAGSGYLLEESERPGELMPIDEDEHGSYILNSKDLRAIEHVQRLAAIGVDSLKIEGRTKSAYYVARTVQAYRRAIDDAVAGRPLDTALLASLEGLSNRGYTDGFLQRHHAADYQNYLRGHSQSARSVYVGRVVEFDPAAERALVEVKNRFAVGDRIELVQPQGNRELVLDCMWNLDGEPIEVAAGSGHRVWLALPAISPGAFVARFI